jgi:hypothetical protein
MKQGYNMQEVREPLDAFQYDQFQRIVAVLGAPSVERWPALEHTMHWKNNTQGVRGMKVEHTPDLKKHLMAQNPQMADDPRKDAAMDLLNWCVATSCSVRQLHL